MSDPVFQTETRFRTMIEKAEIRVSESLGWLSVEIEGAGYRSWFSDKRKYLRLSLTTEDARNLATVMLKYVDEYEKRLEGAPLGSEEKE